MGCPMKALEYPLLFSRAISPPFRCCHLAPPPPSFCWGSCVCVWSCPFCSAFSPPASSPLLASGSVCDWLLSLMFKVGDSCELSYCSGAWVHCLRVEFVLSFTGAAMSFLSFCGFPPPGFFVVSLVCLLFRCFVSLLFGVCMGSVVVFLSLSVWDGEIGPGPEPWTGLHCSELHWR